MKATVNRQLFRFVSVGAIAILAAFAGWVATTSLQQDFAAYWIAGATRRAGLDPYVNYLGDPAAPDLWDGVGVFAHSRFLYPPVAAEAFRALALLPYSAAKALFTALLVVAWALATARVAAAARSRLPWIAGALFYPLYLALERGQVDLLILLLLCAGLIEARAAAAGAALAVAVTLKPGLAMALVVLAALGRVRVAAWAVAGIAALAVASIAISGPRLAREYATDVLPRAALLGEGGDERALLPDERLAARAEDLAAGRAHVDGRIYAASAWDRPASASLPRLLAPETPTTLASRLPALLLAALLMAAAGIARGRRSPFRDAVLPWAAAVASVVASPAGWVMGFVFALPLAPLLGRRELPRAPRAALGLALLTCACPPPFAGWAPVAGTGLVLVATLVATRRMEAA